MERNKIRIVSERGITKVYQGDTEIHGIKYIYFEHDAISDSPTLSIIFSNDGVEIDSDVVPSLPEFYSSFYERKKSPGNTGS